MKEQPNPIDLPLQGLTVLDFSQFLAGPLAALRLADLGARVIKVERPDGGDACRQLYISNLELDGDSTLFHSINRNKQSFSANLKSEKDRATVLRLVERADVMIQNFRPGVIERLGLDYESVRAVNPRIVYGSVSGYGATGPWRDKPGQDLLAQALSGSMWLNGNQDQPPTPVGLSIADMLTGHYLTQGILACLVRRGVTGAGGRVETNLLEAMMDYQFEVITTHLNDGGQPPVRSAIGSAHPYLGAPYGVYSTADGHLALAMGDIPTLGKLLDLPPLGQYSDPKTWFTHRDEIKAEIARCLATRPTQHWLDILEPADVWCSDVFDWRRLLEHDGFKALGMIQQVSRSNGARLLTTRCPMSIDGARLTSPVGAPHIGEHNACLEREFELNA